MYHKKKLCLQGVNIPTDGEEFAFFKDNVKTIEPESPCGHFYKLCRHPIKPELNSPV